MSNRQKQKFKENAELDIAYGVAGLGRFRLNVFQQRGNVGVNALHLRMALLDGRFDPINRLFQIANAEFLPLRDIRDQQHLLGAKLHGQRFPQRLHRRIGRNDLV